LKPKALNPKPPAAVAAVLIGGQSARMGKDKLLLELAGQALIDRVLGTLSAIFPRVILVGRASPELAKRGEVLPDLLPGLGPIAGIYTALKARSAPVFICAADMPFLNADLIRSQLKLLKNMDAVVPKPGGFFEPLHALYAPSCLPAIERLIQSGRKRPVEFFNEIRVREISDREIKRFDPQRLSFFNINTQAELSRAEKLIKARNRK
jgi:molybdopterin-guanine dinucleotide biosynthesis protein A